MLFSSLLLVPTVAHAATGQISVNNGTEIVVTGSATTVSVPINIAGSDPLNGFDVQVVADPAVLSGASVSLSGSILASPSVVIECINGILVVGSTCAPQDANGVVHLGAAQIGSLTSASGLLFTINYNIVGTSAGTPIGFNTGCSGTSVSGDCVTVSNGTPTAVPETDLGSSFANLNDFTATAAFASISTTAGVAISDVINYVAKGAFSDSLTETVTGPCTLASGSVDLSFPTGSDTLTCSSASNGDFPVAVTATGFGSGISHTVNVALHVGPAGFSSSLNPASLTIPRGTSLSSIVTLTGVSAFSGSVSIVATGPAGITGSASPSMVTLTNDGSGYSTATSTLTVNVAGSVATGVYSLAVTGGSTLSVIVPGLDFSISAVPAVESVPRGGAAVAAIELMSLGSFAGTVTFTVAIVPIALDPGSGVANIVGSFIPATVTLTAGGSGSTAFSGGTVKIGRTPNAGNTATGDYVATITATSGSISHSVTLSFNVFDFVFGPTFCSGNTEVDTSPNAFFDPVFVGEQCNTFTLTTQTTANGGAPAVVWTEINALGGFGTFGADGTGVVASGDPTGPGRGTFIPELHHSACMYQTYWGNGTLIPRSYLAANGPVVRDTDGSGCRFGGYAIPNDLEADPYVKNNPDFFQVTADALTHTLPGTYLVDVCGLTGTLINCQRITLIVVSAPVITSFSWTHKGSVSASHGGHFQLRVTNVDATHTIFAQVTITGTGSTGDTFTLTSAAIAIAPNANQPFNIFQTFTSSEIGETFVFTSSIAVSATDAGALTGTSTLQSVSSTFTVGP